LGAAAPVAEIKFTVGYEGKIGFLKLEMVVVGLVLDKRAGVRIVRVKPFAYVSKTSSLSVGTQTGARLLFLPEFVGMKKPFFGVGSFAATGEQDDVAFMRD